jgi:hypothetical protein
VFDQNTGEFVAVLLEFPFQPVSVSCGLKLILKVGVPVMVAANTEKFGLEAPFLSTPNVQCPYIEVLGDVLTFHPK